MQLGAWTGTLGAGILTKSWSLGINPDPQGYSLGSSERTDGWYLNQTPCDCVMLSRHGMQPVPQPPGPYAADEGPSHATPRDQHISPVSPRVHCPMARGPSSCIWKKCTTASFSCLHGHPLGPTASACIFISVSLKWYVTPYCSEYLCWALQWLACMLACSDKLCLLIPLQAPTGLSTQSKANRASTTRLTAVKNITYVHG